MEKQIARWAESSSRCADYFKNARISVHASSEFEIRIEQMSILWLRFTRMSPDVLGDSLEELRIGSVVCMDILLGAVNGIRENFEEALRDAKQTAGSRVYDITDDLGNEPQRLVIKMRSMATVRESQFSTDISQTGGIPFTLSTNQCLTRLIDNLSRLMTDKEQSLFDVLPAARETMKKLCMSDVSQIESEGPAGMESVRKLVMGCDLDPILQQALAPQPTSNNLYLRNSTESGGNMRNGSVGIASKNNRYIGNISKGANSVLNNGDTINGT